MTYGRCDFYILTTFLSFRFVYMAVRKGAHDAGRKEEGMDGWMDGSKDWACIYMLGRFEGSFLIVCDTMNY